MACSDRTEIAQRNGSPGDHVYSELQTAGMTSSVKQSSFVEHAGILTQCNIVLFLQIVSTHYETTATAVYRSWGISPSQWQAVQNIAEVPLGHEKLNLLLPGPSR